MSKKIINLIMGVVLITVSVLSLQIKGSGELACAGAKAEEKIQNIGETYELIDCMASAIDTYGMTPDSEYQSATMHISISKNKNYYYEYTSDDGWITHHSDVKGKVFTEQNISCYITTEGIYVEAKGNLINFADELKFMSSDLSQSSLQYDINLYVTNGKCYIKINDYVSADLTMCKMIKPKYANKWVVAPCDAISTEFSLDAEIGFVFEMLLKMYDSLLTKGFIHRDDTEVFLNEDDLSKLINPIYDDLGGNIEDYKVDVGIDLLDKTRPHILIGAGYDHESKFKLNTRKGKAKEKLKTVIDMTLCDVNNTVIDEKFLDFTIKTNIETLEEFEELFVIEDYGEDKDE